MAATPEQIAAIQGIPNTITTLYTVSAKVNQVVVKEIWIQNTSSTETETITIKVNSKDIFVYTAQPSESMPFARSTVLKPGDVVSWLATGTVNGMISGIKYT